MWRSFWKAYKRAQNSVVDVLLNQFKESVTLNINVRPRTDFVSSQMSANKEQEALFSLGRMSVADELDESEQLEADR